LKAYAAWEPSPARRAAVVPFRTPRPVGALSDVARRLAGEGFFALAVDLYSREGVPDFPDMPAVFRWMRALPDARVLSDLGAAVGFLARRPEVAPTAIGITGFCMGGQYALMAACTVPGLSACVSWYGMLRYAERDAVKPASPLDLAAELACPYLGLFGEVDAIIPLADVEELRGILEGTGKRFEIVTYPGAGHAFFNDTRPEMYRQAAAMPGRAPSASATTPARVVRTVGT
jgi:carboxymethylenebutenolidase